MIFFIDLQDSGGSRGLGYKERSYLLLEFGEVKVRNIDVRCDYYCLYIGFE